MTDVFTLVSALDSGVYILQLLVGLCLGLKLDWR